MSASMYSTAGKAIFAGDSYSPIENYGIIGDMRTCALINKKNGSLDFMCYPDFDSPSVFCRLLDAQVGGFWEINPKACSMEDNLYGQIGTNPIFGSEESSYIKQSNASISESIYSQNGAGIYSSNMKSKQLYLPNSNILLTRFSGESSISQIVDWMPVREKVMRSFRHCIPFSGEEEIGSREPIPANIPVPWIVRKFECIRGTVKVRIHCQPHFDYARANHRLYILPEENNPESAVVRFESSSFAMDLRYTTNFPIQEDARVSRMEYDREKEKNTERDFIPWIAWQRIGNEDWSGVAADIVLLEGQTVTFVMREVPKLGGNAPNYSTPLSVPYCFAYDPPLTHNMLERSFEKTNNYWHDWLAKCTYTGFYRSSVLRSALLLKLMTYYPTGAIVAAPTFSLPEELGGRLNWDYRFTWIRDASFTIYAFIRIGFTEEAGAFMQWIECRCREMVVNGGNLEILYDIHGRNPMEMISEAGRQVPVESNANLVSVQDVLQSVSLDGPNDATSNVTTLRSSLVVSAYESESQFECILPHLKGYKGSLPVRIGNGAAMQSQLDIYGELMDAIYLIDKYWKPVSYSFWLFLRDTLIPLVIARWREADHGIWEFRHGKQHYTYSKVMCWVAMDRAIRLVNKHSLPAPNRTLWMATRDAIYDDVMTNGWDPVRHVFTQFYGSKELDAANLIMPLVFFLPASDPRFLSTLRAILKRPKEGGLTINHLCFRTSPCVPQDVLSNQCSHTDADYIKNEGTFNLCTFWLIEALCRTGDAGHIRTAQLMFEDISGFANHLGLFSEELSVSGKAVGNFPQAFTHLALISAAFNLNKALQDKK